MSVVETTARMGDRFLKGIYAAAMEIQNQADEAYVLAMPSALGVEENLYTKLFKDRTSQNAQDVAIVKTGVGYLEDTSEGDSYKIDARVAGYETFFRYPEFTKSIIVTRKDREDRLVDAKLDEARDLLIGGKMTMNRDAFSFFNYGFTAQASLSSRLTYYADGKPAFSTTHPIKASVSSTTTQSNASSTSIPLSEVNLEVGRTALRRQLDDRGLPSSFGGGPVILLVPDALEKLAVVIAKSTKKSGTLNNDMNVYYGGVVTVISTKWINSQNGGSDTAWYLIDSMRSPLRFITRRALTIDPPYEVTDGSHNVRVDISARYMVGNVDFKGAWASKGDNSSYSG